MASQVGDESLKVETECARVSDQVSQAPATRAFEQQIVHLPESASGTGCLGRFGRLVGMRADLREAGSGEARSGRSVPMTPRTCLRLL